MPAFRVVTIPIPDLERLVTLANLGLGELSLPAEYWAQHPEEHRSYQEDEAAIQRAEAKLAKYKGN